MTHDALPGETAASGRFAAGRLLRFDRVFLGDFQSLMGLHAAITDKFRTLDAPRRGDGIVRATTALDHVLGGLDAAGVVVGRAFAEEHIVDDELHPGFHFAHRAV